MDPHHTEDYPNRVFKNPADYFRPDREIGESPLAKPIIYSTALSATLGGSFFYNYQLERPILLSGVHRHIAMASLGIVGAFLFHKWRMRILAERDSVIRHYIELHPDDFPPYERRQYKDILDEWVPRR